MEKNLIIKEAFNDELSKIAGDRELGGISINVGTNNLHGTIALLAQRTLFGTINKEKKYEDKNG